MYYFCLLLCNHQSFIILNLVKGIWFSFCGACVHKGECVCVCVSVSVCVQLSLSCVQLFVTPWTVTHQVPLSMEFSRQEYWSWLPFATPGDLPNSGIKPYIWCLLHWQEDSLPLCHLGSPEYMQS